MKNYCKVWTNNKNKTLIHLRMKKNLLQYFESETTLVG